MWKRTLLGLLWAALWVGAQEEGEPTPNCYVTRLPKGKSCLHKGLCIRVRDAAVGEAHCRQSGALAKRFGYTRAVYAAEPLQCQMIHFADGHCEGDPSEDLADDIKLTPEQEENMVDHGTLAVAGRYAKKWPLKNGRYMVPYQIVTPSAWTAAQVEDRKWGMAWFELNTKITFVPRRGERDYIMFIESTKGCWSHVGRVGGAQTISLTQGCKQLGVMMHEILHALGSGHEHQRGDRDEHLNVYLSNIRNGKDSQFTKNMNDTVTPYDLASLMQYGSQTFSKARGKDTMLPKDRTKKDIMNSSLIGPSWCDFWGLNKYYGNIGADIPCKPEVFVVTCEPTKACVYDCEELCAAECQSGLLTGECQKKWTSQQLREMTKDSRSSGVPYRYKIHDPELRTSYMLGSVESKKAAEDAASDRASTKDKSNNDDGDDDDDGDDGDDDGDDGGDDDTTEGGAKGTSGGGKGTSGGGKGTSGGGKGTNGAVTTGPNGGAPALELKSLVDNMMFIPVVALQGLCDVLLPKGGAPRI